MYNSERSLTWSSHCRFTWIRCGHDKAFITPAEAQCHDRIDTKEQKHVSLKKDRTDHELACASCSQERWNCPEPAWDNGGPTHAAF